MISKINSRPTVVLTTEQLRRLTDEAEALRFSNGPNDKFWEMVDPNGFHVVEIWFVHRPDLDFWKGIQHEWNFAHGGGKNIRAMLTCKMLGTMKPTGLLCDFDHDSFLEHLKLARKTRRTRRRKTAAAG